MTDIVERLRELAECERPFIRGFLTAAASHIEGVEVRRDNLWESLKAAEDRLVRMEQENWALKQALGYPVPAQHETINNPFKCGMCDARRADEKIASLNTRVKHD